MTETPIVKHPLRSGLEAVFMRAVPEWSGVPLYVAELLDWLDAHYREAEAERQRLTKEIVSARLFGQPSRNPGIIGQRVSWDDDGEGIVVHASWSDKVLASGTWNSSVIVQGTHVLLVVDGGGNMHEIPATKCVVEGAQKA